MSHDFKELNEAEVDQISGATSYKPWGNWGWGNGGWGGVPAVIGGFLGGFFPFWR
ncbi:MAG: hypothetical protein ACK5II_05160 [Paracoccus sp. (in: a-proteobacteria)]